MHRAAGASTAGSKGFATVSQLLAIMASFVVHLGTEAFPLQHSFVDAKHSGDPAHEHIRVTMTHFVAFLDESVQLRHCPLRVVKTSPSRALGGPLSDFVAIPPAMPGSGARTYKCAEGLWNLTLTAKGKLLGDAIELLTVHRKCLCNAVQWQETVTVKDVTDRTLQIRFKQFSADHSVDCVPLGAKKRPVPLIGARVAVKEVGRDVTARPGQIEQGIITTSSASHHPDAICC